MSPVVKLIVASALVALAACGEKPSRPVTSTPVPDSADSSEPSAASQFAAVRLPTAGRSQVFGSYTRGCIAGAASLPLSGAHWQVLKPSRNRMWGHPNLIAFIGTLSEQVAADGYRGLLVGDLAQPRGGPLPSSHNSHQVGLDADIWLTPMPARKLDADDVESYEPASFVDFDAMKVTGAFGAAQLAMVKRAAEADEVERIFVSPVIKRALCQRSPVGARDWLRKVRPWTGHSAHMHVRLACPSGSGDCKAQDQPPEGDGCGAELQSWFDDRSWMQESTGTYVPKKPLTLDQLPDECRSVLAGQG